MQRLLFCFWGILVSYTYLQGVPSLSSDKPIVYDAAKNCSLAEGHAEFLNGNTCLQADRIYYFAENAKVLADGNVRITNPFLRVKTSEGVFYKTTGEMQSPEFEMEVQGKAISGKNLRGTREHLLADDVVIGYNGNMQEWDVANLKVAAKTCELHGQDYMELRDAVFYIGKIPFFYSPYYRHNFDRSVIRLKSDFGFLRRDKTFGRYIRNDVFFDFGWRVKPGLLLDYYRKRGTLVGGLLEYSEDFGQGFFKATRIHDEDIVTHRRHDPFLTNSRYWIEWRHNGSWGNSTDVVSQIDWMSDKAFIKDFRPDENDGSRQHPDNFVEISHRTENSVTSLLTRYRFNHFQQIQERLPELRFDYLPVRLWDSPLYHQWGVGVSHLRENTPRGALRQTSSELRRVDGYWGVSMPIKMGSCCSFTPLASTRLAHYWGLDKSYKQHYMRCLGQLGFDLRFHAYADYDFESEYWNIHRFRHLVQPVIQYRYMPHGYQGDSFISSIDREALDGRRITLREIDLLNRRDIDNLNDMHLLRLGVENVLYTNYTTGDPQQWMRFNVYQDIRLKKNVENSRQQRTLSDFFADFEWTPASYFSTNQYLRFDPTEKRLREATASVSLKESDLWTLTISHDYLQDAGEWCNNQNSLSLAYRINSFNVFSVSISVDAHKPDLIRQKYTWSTIISKTWKLDLVFEWKKRQRPLAWNTEDSWNIRFILNLIEW